MEYFLIYFKMQTRVFKVKLKKIIELYRHYRKWSLLFDENLKNRLK